MIEAFLFPHGSTGGQNCHGLVHGVKLAKAIAVDARAQLVVVDVFDGLLELMLAVLQNVAAKLRVLQRELVFEKRGARGRRRMPNESQQAVQLCVLAARDVMPHPGHDCRIHHLRP